MVATDTDESDSNFSTMVVNSGSDDNFSTTVFRNDDSGNFSTMVCVPSDGSDPMNSSEQNYFSAVKGASRIVNEQSVLSIEELDKEVKNIKKDLEDLSIFLKTELRSQRTFMEESLDAIRKDLKKK